MSSQQQLVKLTVLPVNKTVVFYSPIEGKDVLVRTGVIGEGSCFMNSLLHGYSKDYVKMDKTERLKLADKIKKNLSDKLDQKKWETDSGGLVAKIPFQDNVREILTDFYRHIPKNKTCKTRGAINVVEEIVKTEIDSDMYGIICELITLEIIEKDMLSQAYDKCADENITKSKKIIINTCVKHAEKIFEKLGKTVDEEHKKVCVIKFGKLIDKVLNEAENNAYKTYLKNTKDTSIDVNSYTIQLLSERFNRDIYFLDARTRMPYLVDNENSMKKRKSLILIWLGGMQYEIVGRLLPGNKIQREFEEDDPLIKRIYIFLYKQEKVASQYPNLVPYLPKKQREKLGLKSQSKSQSKSETDSRKSEEKDSESKSENSDSKSESSQDSDSESGSESESQESRSDSGSNSASVQASQKSSPAVEKSPKPDMLNHLFNDSPQKQKSPDIQKHKKSQRHSRHKK